MPHIIVKWYPGRSQAQKEELARAITRDVAAIAGCAETSISIALEEVAPKHGRKSSTGPISLKRRKR